MILYLFDNLYQKFLEILASQQRRMDFKQLGRAKNTQAKKSLNNSLTTAKKYQCSFKTNHKEEISFRKANRINSVLQARVLEKLPQMHQRADKHTLLQNYSLSLFLKKLNFQSQLKRMKKGNTGLNRGIKFSGKTEKKQVLVEEVEEKKDYYTTPHLLNMKQIATAKIMVMDGKFNKQLKKKREEEESELNISRLKFVNYLDKGLKDYIDPMPPTDDLEDSQSNASNDSVLQVFKEERKQEYYRPSTQNFQLRKQRSLSFTQDLRCSTQNKKQRAKFEKYDHQDNDTQQRTTGMSKATDLKHKLCNYLQSRNLSARIFGSYMSVPHYYPQVKEDRIKQKIKMQNSLLSSNRSYLRSCHGKRENLKFVILGKRASTTAMNSKRV